jgi:polyhydroxyalkanoate synthesis regulator phasin
MTTLDEVRKSIEATIGNLTPAKAQELARSLSDPGTAKEQVARLAADILEWSQRSRERLRDFIGNEISNQLTSMGVATRSEVDALKKRVRELERRAGMTASGRRSGARKSAAKKPAARKPTVKKPAAADDA